MEADPPLGAVLVDEPLGDAPWAGRDEFPTVAAQHAGAGIQRDAGLPSRLPASLGDDSEGEADFGGLRGPADVDLSEDIAQELPVELETGLLPTPMLPSLG